MNEIIEKEILNIRDMIYEINGNEVDVRFRFSKTIYRWNKRSNEVVC